MKTLLLATAALGLCFLPRADDHAADREAITAAALDYVEGIYSMAPDRVRRSVHPELVKYGYGRWDGPEYKGYPMTFEQLVELSKNWNESGRAGADAAKDIVVLDHLDKTAAVKLTAYWGVDYFQLVKDDDGKWKIRHVLWQTIATPEGVEEEHDVEADKKAVERAVLNYVESAYDVRPENIDRSVDRGLVKLGYTKRDAEEGWKRHDMNFDQLRELVSGWNKEKWMPADAQKDVVVLDVLDKTASAKATAHWGVDYFHLVKDDEGTWKITQVVWQSHPLAKDAE
ncbi:MAG: nuclear transport factor 2 family protein [Planctomycetota bacterium]